MAEETENLTEQIGESVNKVEQFVENNKKSLIIGGVVVILLICGFFAYKNLYLGKKQSEVLAAMYPAQVQFSRDSFHIALYGNENVTGFEDIVKEYGNTKAGNTANYYAGICALNLGEFDAAIDYLKDFSTDDLVLEPLAAGLIGDAYSEKEEYSKAASQYEKAANMELLKKENIEIIRFYMQTFSSKGNYLAANFQHSNSETLDEFTRRKERITITKVHKLVRKLK